MRPGRGCPHGFLWNALPWKPPCAFYPLPLGTIREGSFFCGISGITLQREPQASRSSFTCSNVLTRRPRMDQAMKHHTGRMKTHLRAGKLLARSPQRLEARRTETSPNESRLHRQINSQEKIPSGPISKGYEQDRAHAETRCHKKSTKTVSWAWGG